MPAYLSMRGPGGGGAAGAASGRGTNWAGAPSGTGFFDSIKYSLSQNLGKGFGNQAKGSRMVAANPAIRNVPLSVQPYAARQASGQAQRAAAGAGALSFGRNLFNQQNAARATLASIMGNYAAADAPTLGAIGDQIERERQNWMLKVAGIDADKGYATQLSNLDRLNLNIGQRANAADRNMIEELLRLNNQSFGVTLTAGRGELDRYDLLDKFAQEGRQLDIRDFANQRAGVAEEKRLADFNVSGKAGAESGISSGSARMGFKANTTAMNIAGEKINVLDVQSEQQLQKALADNKFGRDKVNWDLQQAGISRREREIQLEQRRRTLDDEAARLGISRKKLEIELQKQLNDLNLSRLMSVGQYADARAKGQISIGQLMRDRAAQFAQNPQAQAAARTLVRPVVSRRQGGGKRPPRVK